MRFLLIGTLLILLGFPAHAEMLPEAIPEEKNKTYDTIARSITEQFSKGSLNEPYTMIGMMLQMMPVDERQKLVMDVAKELQLAPKQKRLEGLEATAAILRGLNDAQRTNLFTQTEQTLQVMTPVERQIIGVQMNKLLADFPEIPQEDRAALDPALNMIISKALAQ